VIITTLFTVAVTAADITTTRDYLIKHTIYETLFISLFLSFPSGFMLHYYQTFVRKKEEAYVAGVTSSVTTSFE
jgi:hypothetical protein